MTKVLVIYATDYGNTKKMAETIASGVKTVAEAQVDIKLADDVTTEEMMNNDAFIIGSPVHMGSPDWRIKKFIDKVCSRLWMKDALVGKVGGVFASGGGYGGGGGGCEVTLLALLNNLVELGMVIVPLPKCTPGYEHGGIQWGPYGRSMGLNMEQIGVTEEMLEVAKHHGANIARVAVALQGKELFASKELCHR